MVERDVNKIDLEDQCITGDTGCLRLLRVAEGDPICAHLWLYSSHASR